MKKINVACALIYYDSKILICQRSGGKFDNLWEFPGGKIESQESSIEAIKREIMEELNLEIINPKYLFNINYEYADFRLTMKVFKTNILNKNEIKLNVHKQILWVDLLDIEKFNLLPADYLILNKIKNPYK